MSAVLTGQSSSAPQSSADTDYRIRFVTAASLFDGHDASINIIRRLLQASGAEVIHLGHNRSVAEIVDAAVQEDVQGIAVSSYQGGHTEYFRYMVDMLSEKGRGDIRVFAGGGGVIVDEEIQALHDYGVSKIYSPEDGQRLGLQGMIDDMLSRANFYPGEEATQFLDKLDARNHACLARVLTEIENSTLSDDIARQIQSNVDSAQKKIPVIGITGTGGSGKSSLTDELILRLRIDSDDELRIAVLAVDPTRRKTGGALLGDRIRMNAIEGQTVFFRSIATRAAGGEIPAELSQMVTACRAADFDLVIVETPGIGQGDAGIVEEADVSLYVMTPEFGAASQLEKIEMLDYADLVAINKSDRKGSKDALRDVRKQMQRNRAAFSQPVENMPVFTTMASRFNDAGVTDLYRVLRSSLVEGGFVKGLDHLRPPESERSLDVSIPSDRERYLSEIASSVRRYHNRVCELEELARRAQHLRTSIALLEERSDTTHALVTLLNETEEALGPDMLQIMATFDDLRGRYEKDTMSFDVRGERHDVELSFTSLSGTRIPKISLPRYHDAGDRLRWQMLENLPGLFPFTAGVFPFKRANEDPTRMFAGEGDAARTNQRFKLLSADSSAKRLSTAFDSVTLYGADPALRPDIYGKVGTSGVSIATLDDMKVLYEGFDLCDPATSVSMTINGPAPTVLAFFLNTAIDQQVDKFNERQGRLPTEHEHEEIKSRALKHVRGTVQADILKEDQGQNTCLFSTDFSLRMMGDIQEYFIDNQVRNFYSVSISGYHIAEAGANPITQLALTLSNGFTYVESYLARGMAIDDFAPNLSFFFSNGMDPEYTVLGRVARRIWSIAMRDRYGASERSQKLKYHIQTSGRSLHAQEMSFNDIRTTLQALIAVYDNCNSLHTNAHDEAFTTPSEESVRRALAIQLIINREWGLAKNENANQGSFIIEELTDLVEQAVLAEFDRLSERGGVLGAMETGYQRGKIQEESLYYETQKHDGTFPIVGVNTFVSEEGAEKSPVALARGTELEKQRQLKRLAAFHEHNEQASRVAVCAIKDAALTGENVFYPLMDAARVCSLGQLTQAFFEVGGKYRRGM
ncbi:MAG: methylmalonyl-CoA mutase family protein [Gammaproteobacteria bacterium]|nr:methylmalonyl-CoA mutase family protein [Gammaproteobacteria bacterium]